MWHLHTWVGTVLTCCCQINSSQILPLHITAPPPNPHQRWLLGIKGLPPWGSSFHFHVLFLLFQSPTNNLTYVFRTFPCLYTCRTLFTWYQRQGAVPQILAANLLPIQTYQLTLPAEKNILFSWTLNTGLLIYIFFLVWLMFAQSAEPSPMFST
jgi:hypothetical protein